MFENDLVAVECVKFNLTLNPPTYAGFIILEFSKVLMYDFHYNFFKRNYGDKSHLLFTDNDSLTYEIETPNIYNDMTASPNHFDFLEYLRNDSLYSELNKKFIGKFKDELNGDVTIEFVDLTGKMYFLLTTS